MNRLKQHLAEKRQAQRVPRRVPWLYPLVPGPCPHHIALGLCGGCEANVDARVVTPKDVAAGYVGWWES
jgi:hypothetical protein